MSNVLFTKSYKIFVKESEVNPSEKKVDKEEDKFKTNISGDEAKKIYEDIINKISEKKKPDITNIKQEKQTIIPKNYNYYNNNSNNSYIEINSNKILKAVEQHDIDYLKKYLNTDNVNKIFDNYGWTPLMSAACCGNEFIVKFLLELGANKNYMDKSGLTALKLAKKNNFNNIVALLKIDYTKKHLTKNIDTNENQTESNSSLTCFYCEICKKNYTESTLKEHEASIVHNLNKNPELPPPFYGLPKQNKGYQIMLNNGWNDKNGLGPYGSGLKYPIKTILKRDRRGLGKKPYDKPKVTHFKSNDINAVTHVKQKNILQVAKALSKKDRRKIIDRERRKERELRQALS